MKKKIQTRTAILFIVSVALFLVILAFASILFFRFEKSTKNRDLLLTQIGVVESVSRKMLQSYIYLQAERRYGFELANLMLDIEPQMQFLSSLGSVLKSGGEIAINRSSIHYPPLPDAYADEIREVTMLVNAFINIKKTILEGTGIESEKSIALLTTVIEQLSRKSGMMYRDIDRENRQNRATLLISVAIAFLVITVSFLFMFVSMASGVLRPLRSIISVSSKVSAGDLTVFIPQAHYRKCTEVLRCTNEACPSFATKNKACWRINDGGCVPVVDGASRERINCVDCRVYNESVRDEIEELIESTNNMIASFRMIASNVKRMVVDLDDDSMGLGDISRKIQESSERQSSTFEEASSAHEELIASIENVSVFASRQAERVGQTTAAMEELSSSIRSAGDNSKKVSAETRNTVDEARATEDMLVQSTQSISQISESSHKIVDIISIINDISEKINLLSLNASIEAARAGEHGRGFAVVAEEISKLAEATASSTKEIETLITGSRHDIDSGAEMINKTADSIRSVIHKIETAAARIEDIAVSTVEQVLGGESVMKDVEEINSMSEQIEQTTSEQKLTGNELLKAVDLVSESIHELTGMSVSILQVSESIKEKTAVLKESVAHLHL